MRKKIKLIIGLFLICSLFSSLIMATPKYDVQNKGLIYGLIDLSDTNYFLSDIFFLEYPEKIPGKKKIFFKTLSSDIIWKNGLFVFTKIPPGKYILAYFRLEKYGYSLEPVVECWIPTPQLKESVPFTVKAGEICYYGSYKYITVQKAKLFSKEKFDLEKTDSFSRKELLQKLLTNLGGTDWEAKINQELSKMR